MFERKANAVEEVARQAMWLYHRDQSKHPWMMHWYWCHFQLTSYRRQVQLRITSIFSLESRRFSSHVKKQNH